MPVVNRLAGVSIRTGDVARSHVSLLSTFNAGNDRPDVNFDCFKTCCWCC